jgi:hypothetical protein
VRCVMSYTANFVNDFRIKIKHKIYRRCHGNNLQKFVSQSAGLYGLSFKCFRRSVAKLTLLLYADTNFNESCLLLHNIAHRERKPQRGPCHGSGGYSPASHRGGPGSIPGRSQWPRSLRRGSTAARLLGLWVRIPPGAWMFVFVVRTVAWNVK